MGAAAKFVARVITGVPDRNVSWPMEETQALTRQYLYDCYSASSRLGLNEENADQSPAQIVTVGSIVAIQDWTLQRAVNALDVADFYSSMTFWTSKLITNFVSTEANPINTLLYALLGTAKMSFRQAVDRANFVDINITNQLTQEQFQIAAESFWGDYGFMAAYRALYDNTTEASVEIDEALALSSERNAVLQGFNKSGAWVLSVSTPTPSLYLTSIHTFFTNFLDAMTTSGEYLFDPLGRVVTAIITAAISITIAASLALYVVVKGVRALLSETDQAQEAAHMQLLEAANSRIQKFISSVATMDVANIVVPEGKLQSLERDVYTLEQPSKQLVQFLHTAHLMLPGESSTELIPRGVSIQTLTILFIDVDGWQGRVTSDLAKTLPRDFSLFVRRVSDTVLQNGGVMHEISGSRIIAVWNLYAESFEAEANASSALVSLHKNWISEYAHLRFAIVTGECTVGTVGTETLKTFTILGPPMSLGGMLLKLNRLHSSLAIVDEATFGKLDGQVFRTRPLEIVAVDPQSSKCVAYEMMLGAQSGDKEGRLSQWNEIFDDYKSLNFAKAANRLRQWQQTFGDTRTAQRLLMLVSEVPPRECTYRRNDDGLIEDELM
jgi:class 3 adenylate cyclase